MSKAILYDFLTAEASIYPASHGAAKEGDAIIDMQGYERALIICYSGAVTTDTVFELKHGDASDLSDAAAVSASDILGSEPTLAAATDNECEQFEYIGTKRYLRVDTTAGAGIAGAIIVKGNPRHET